MTNFKIVFGLLCCVVLSYQVEMKIWDQAGEWILIGLFFGQIIFEFLLNTTIYDE